MAEIESIIQKHLQGKASEEETKQLYQWMQESAENRKRFFAEKDIWDSYGFHSNQKSYNIAPELELLKKDSVQPPQSLSPDSIGFCK